MGMFVVVVVICEGVQGGKGEGIMNGIVRKFGQLMDWRTFRIL